jgi:hypothetical protein
MFIVTECLLYRSSFRSEIYMPLLKELTKSHETWAIDIALLRSQLCNYLIKHFRKFIDAFAADNPARRD